MSEYVLLLVGPNAAALAGGLGMLAAWGRLVPYEPGDTRWLVATAGGAAIAALLGWAVVYEAFVA